MITAKCERFNEDFRVDGLVNRGEWFGKTWLLAIGCGHSSINLVVEGDNEQDILDAYADSTKAHLTLITHPDDAREATQFLGNYGDPHDLDNILILGRCKVNYFAKRSGKVLRENEPATFSLKIAS